MCGELYSPTLYPAASRTDSSMAQVDPLPLVPATVMMVASSSSARRRFTAVTRSSPSSMLVGWMRSMYASHSESVLAAMRVRDRMTLFERVILDPSEGSYRAGFGRMGFFAPRPPNDLG